MLGAAAAHAAWNALLKSGTDPLLDAALLALAASALAAPALALVEPPGPQVWPNLLASASIHVGYYATLSFAYRAGDLAQAYPIMRGTAPLFVALFSAAAFGETLSPGAWSGIALICAGVLSLGLCGGGANRRASAWALANAAIIAAYTLVDGAGVRAAGGAERYVVWQLFLMGLPFGLAVLALRGRALARHAARYWPRALAGAALSGAAYGVALWAMTRAPIAVVAALRETSVIFGALLGTWVLGEGRAAPRLAGAAAVFAGLVALRL